MENLNHIEILKKGVSPWNQWRTAHPTVRPSLHGVNLTGVNLQGVDLNRADLSQAILHKANLNNALLMRAALHGADLQGVTLKKANLTGAKLIGAILHDTVFENAKLNDATLKYALINRANFVNANLSDAELRDVKGKGPDFSDARLAGANLQAAMLPNTNFQNANLSNTNLRKADLSNSSFKDANLRNASLVETIIMGVNFEGCRIYGVSAWDLKGESKNENNLVINPSGGNHIQVDSLEVAQFIYLILNNKKLRRVVDTITSKAVLVLGRFTEKRKKVLDAIRDKLRSHNYLPIIFDFEASKNRDLTETITLLAGMSRFVIADLTDPKSIPQELTAIIPDHPSIPIQPIILNSQSEYAMYEHWKKYPWVLSIYRYDSVDEIVNNLMDKVILPAETAINLKMNN